MDRGTPPDRMRRNKHEFDEFCRSFSKSSAITEQTVCFFLHLSCQSVKVRPKKLGCRCQESLFVVVNLLVFQPCKNKGVLSLPTHLFGSAPKTGTHDPPGKPRMAPCRTDGREEPSNSMHHRGRCFRTFRKPQ